MSGLSVGPLAGWLAMLEPEIVAALAVAPASASVMKSSELMVAVVAVLTIAAAAARLAGVVVLPTPHVPQQSRRHVRQHPLQS